MNNATSMSPAKTVARLVRRGRRYVLFSLDPRLREIDECVFDSVAAAREAVLVTLDGYDEAPE